MRHLPFPGATRAALALLLLVACTTAASAPPPRVPGQDPVYTQGIAAEFDRLADGVMATGQVVGLATVVMQGGRVVSRRTLGVRDSATRTPVTADTAFRIASLSKAFASTLTAMLVQDGYLSWDNRVQDLVPVFDLIDTRESSKVTVKDLLSHRVGLPHNAQDMLLERDEPYPMLVYRLREVPLVCQPGDCYAYQNVAFSMIGDVTFASTGDFYYHQVERRIFHPLGMETATYGRDSLEASADWARPHVRRGRRWVALRPKESYYRVPPAAGVNASITDMSKWLAAQLGHRPDVLSTEILDTMHTPVVATPGELHTSAPWRRMRVTGAQYALGWRVFDYGGHRLVWHAGAVQGYRAMIALLPEYDFGAVILWNCESNVPAGLLPTLLDRFLGLPPRDWLELGRFPHAPVLAAAGAK